MWDLGCFLFHSLSAFRLEPIRYFQPTTQEGLILVPKWKPGRGLQTWLCSLPELAASLVPSSNWTAKFWYIKACRLGPEKEDTDIAGSLLLDIEPIETGPINLDSVCSLTQQGSEQAGPEQAGSESDDDAVQTEAVQRKPAVSQAFKSAALDIHGPLLPQEEVDDIIQRAAKGKTIQLADGIKVLFTFRQPNKQNPCGGFQVRCYCHEPDKKMNKQNQPYSLACRRTLSIPGSGQAAETLQHLCSWALAGPNFDSRVKHQAMALPGGKTKGKPAKVRIGGKKPPSKVKRSSSSSSSGSSSSSSSSSDSSSSRQSSSKPKARMDELRLPQGVANLSAGILVKGTYELSDVPADGDCMFTALGRELECKQNLIPGMRLPSGQFGSNMGPRWRSQLVQSVRRLASSRTEIEGLGISDWLQHSGWPDLESYIDGMTLATENPADPRQHWGGFLEATILCQATSPLVGCLLARQVREGIRCQAWCGAPFQAGAPYVAMCWTGNHWQRLRLRRAAEQKLQEWFLSV